MPKPSKSVSPEVLLDTIAHRAIPRIEQGGMQRVVIARKAWRELQLPTDVRISHKKLLSDRTGTHGPRLYGNASAPSAQWPKDDQESTRVSLLAYVVAGQADLQIGNYVLHCPEGTFIFMPPGVPHPGGRRSHLEGDSRKDGSCELLWFSPQGRRVQCWICYSQGEHHEVSKGHENVFPLNDQLIHFFDFLQEEAVSRQKDGEKLFEGALRLLLMAVHRELKEGRFLHLGVNAGDEPAPSIGYDPILRAQEYILAHLAGTLTIDKVAHVVHMSRAQFTRRFHQQTGKTFIEFVSAARIEQAQIFLRETDWSVAAISEFIGFRSVPHFHALFKSLTGVPPIEFRRLHAKKRREDEALESAKPRRRPRKTEPIPE